MKKYAAIAVFLVIAMGLLSACGERRTAQLEETEIQQLPSEQNGFFIQSKKPAYSPEEDEVVLVLQNDSDQKITYTKHFVMEKKEDGSWYEVPFKDGAVFTEVALMIPPGKSVLEPVPLYLFERPLSEGTYRIVKKIDGIHMAAEFKIAQ